MPEFFNGTDAEISYNRGERVAVTWVDGWKWCCRMKQTRAFFNRFSIGVTALWLLLFALLPNIGLLVVTVLTRGEQDFVLPQFTLDNYLRLLDPTFLKILWESLWLAFMSTLACLLVGYPFAYQVARASAKMKPWLLLLVIIPFWTNSTPSVPMRSS